jgi:methylenetetrahydrofolate--tRNA-(uracil-5-)-methyltransferase
MVPALRDAEFLRFGSIHRNSYIDAPSLLGPELELKSRPDVRFAGLLTGVEGYIESCAMGLLVAWFTAGRLRGEPMAPPPPTTAFGGLYRHVVTPRGAKQGYTPTNINFGLLPPLTGKVVRKEKKRMIAERAAGDFAGWLAQAQRRAA